MPKTSKPAALQKRDKKTTKKKSLDSADDWLEEAIALEDSGDRWVQDPPKAHRFYLQSLAAYEKALNLNAALFDAAYNHARLHLQIAQACALLAIPRLKSVRSAILEHRQLVTNHPDNSDVKYNLAMVLLYYVELTGEHEILSQQADDSSRESAVKEAMQLLIQCSEAQAAELTRMQADETDTIETDDQSSKPQTTQDDEMSLDVTYISHDILFDTLLSMIEAYTALLDLDAISDVKVLQEAGSFVKTVVIPQINAVMPQCQAVDLSQRYTDLQHSMQIAQLEAGYRSQSITLEEYQSSLGQLQNDVSSAAICCSNADACIALADFTREADLDQNVTWKVLTNGASDQITKAIAHMTTLKTRAPAMHITKGDIELLRAAVQTDMAQRNRTTLLKNAAVHYKRAMADCLPKDIRVQNEAALKCAIVEGELSPSSTPPVPQMTTDEASQIITNARADGLFRGSWRLLDAQS